MDIAQVSIIHHTALILGLLWLLTYLGWAHPVAFFVSLLYLYKVNERYSLRLRRRLQFEERKYANQRKLLSDTESVRWLNHAIEKIWPICMEQIASQLFLMPVIPWFLEKYKPWTAKEVVVQHLYLGRKPPVFTEIRVLGESADDDHLVLELGMSFLSADDMSIILAVKPRLGLGIWANMHLTGMHVEGKVLVGVKFLRQWPFLGRMRVCFVEPPYFQMTVKPIFNHGVDVTELPGIAGWLDNMLAVAFEQTLVEPNMLVVDVEKFASSPTENWFTVDEKAPIAYAKVEIIEAADLKPSDLNGLADPYVKGHLGTYRFRTKIQKKNLNPKWLEDFKIPIATWEGPNLLVLELRDKDHIFDDMLGDCAININEFRGGQRHDKWLPLLNIKKGRVHVAITVVEGEDEKGKEQKSEYKGAHQDSNNEAVSDGAQTISPSLNQKVQNQNSKAEESCQMVDQYEPIDIEGQEKTGLWVHHPGSDISQSWEPRRGRARHPETKVQRESNESFEGADSPRSAGSGSQLSDSNDKDSRRVRRLSTIKKGLHKIGSMFHSSSKDESPRRDGDDFVIPSPRPNIRAIGEKRTPVRVIYDDSGIVASDDEKLNSDTCSPEKDEGENSKREHAKGIAKSIMKQAGKSAHSLKNVLSRKGSFGLSEEQMSEMEMKEASEGSESATALKDAYSPAAQDEEFSDAKEVDVRQRKDDEKSVRFQENTVPRNSQTS